MKSLALLLLLVGCSREPSPWEKVGVRVIDGAPQLDDVEIELSRTTCFGICPAYTLKLSGNGELTYTGQAFVKTKGTRSAAIDPRGLLPLLERFQQLDFFGQEHVCTHIVIDNPHACLRLQVGSRSRTVCDGICSGDMDGMLHTQAHASEVEWHKKAFELEGAIDNFANIETWIGTDAERQAHTDTWR